MTRRRGPHPRYPRTPCPLTPLKRAFATRTAAEDSARRRAGVDAGDLSAYLCDCGWWHVTHRPRPGETGETGDDGGVDERDRRETEER